MTDFEKLHAQKPATTPLEIESGELKWPISFKVTSDGSFFFNTVSKGDNEGASLGGHISGENVKLNCVKVDRLLRGMNLGSKLLTMLEEELKKLGIKTIYATFARPDQIGFFRSNGYVITPLELITKEIQEALAITPECFHSRVKNDRDYDDLLSKREVLGDQSEQILLMKRI